MNTATKQEWYPAGWIFGSTLDESDTAIALTDATDPDAWSYEVCLQIESAAIKAGKLLRGKVQPHVSDDERQELATIAANLRLLRDCWRTPAYVWDAVLAVAGRPKTVTDPFFHPLAATAGIASVTLDGHGGRDGFDLNQWKGFALVNGPHSDSARVAETAARYGRETMGKRGHGAALVAPARGDQWFLKHCAAAPIWLHFGRVAFDPPPHVPKSGPPGAMIVPMWIADDASQHTKRLASDGHFRLAVAVNERRTIEVLVTRGVSTGAVQM